MNISDWRKNDSSMAKYKPSLQKMSENYLQLVTTDDHVYPAVNYPDFEM